MAKAGSQLRVGCSGWSYPHWRGSFYPPDLKGEAWFGYYARQFDTVEINNTFYRLPAPETVDQWREQAPEGFLYAAKLGAFGSHRKKLRDPESWLPKHLERTGRLAEHLGPQLAQLPPHWKVDVERLDEFLEALPRDQKWAVEFRDRSWLADPVFERLAAHGVALCVHDRLPGHPWLVTADWAYVRFHGPAGAPAYSGDYGLHGLRTPIRRLRAWLGQGHEVFAYFNNDLGGAAPRDARRLRDRLTGDR